MREIEVVVFDVGETLVSETRVWGGWADWVGVSHFTFFAALGSVIERNQDHRTVFEIVRPGFDFERERQAKEAAGREWQFTAEDLYPDAADCLVQLRDAGLRVGIAANQPAAIEKPLAAIGLAVDFIATSETWGVEKPSPRFFELVAEAAGVEPTKIAYVGDRVDNDVIPARQAGMFTVFIRRGPWGYIHALRPEAATADARIDSLAELPPLLGGRSRDT